MNLRAALIAGAAGAALVVLCGVGVNWYGNARYDDGYAAATADQAIETARVAATYREREQQLRVESDERYAAALARINAQQANIDRLTSDSAGLREQIATERARAAERAKRAGADVAKAAGPWDVLAACERRYTELVRDVEQIIGDFMVAQSWASVIDPDGAKRHGYEPPR